MAFARQAGDETAVGIDHRRRHHDDVDAGAQDPFVADRPIHHRRLPLRSRDRDRERRKDSEGQPGTEGEHGANGTPDGDRNVSGFSER